MSGYCNKYQVKAVMEEWLSPSSFNDIHIKESLNRGETKEHNFLRDKPEIMCNCF